ETENRLAASLRGRVIGMWPVYRSRYAARLKTHCQRRSLRSLQTLDPFGTILQAIYVEVDLDRRWAEKHSGKRRASWNSRTPRPLEHFLRTDDAGVFTVTGSAGSGKTSMLRRIAYELCQ